MNAGRRLFQSAQLPIIKISSQSRSLHLNKCKNVFLLTRSHKPEIRRALFPIQKCTSHQVRFMSSNSEENDVTVAYRHGLPVITLTLPSRHEKCSFTLRPLMSTVGQFLNDLKAEDKGIDRTAIYSTDGIRVASSTQVEHLLSDTFVLSINDVSYTVSPPPIEKASSESIHQLDDVKRAVAQLYTSLQVDQYYLQQEKQALERLEDLKVQLEPLEKMKAELEAKASSRTNFLMWGGLAFMATQFGILARLTWWEYSWDIMEPVTYFITYGTAISMYGYFLLTKQEYMYPDARDRQYLRFFHKAAGRSDFDVTRYNSLHDRIAEAERDLQRLQEPMKSVLPIKASESKKTEEKSA